MCACVAGVPCVRMRVRFACVLSLCMLGVCALSMFSVLSACVCVCELIVLHLIVLLSAHMRTCEYECEVSVRLV